MENTKIINTKIINTQIKYLVNEYNYQTYVNTCNYWYKSKIPIYKYILYKCKSKNDYYAGWETFPSINNLITYNNY